MKIYVVKVKKYDWNGREEKTFVTRTKNKEQARKAFEFVKTMFEDMRGGTVVNGLFEDFFGKGYICANDDTNTIRYRWTVEMTEE